MSDCRYGAPIFASFPHFYLANASYLNAVTGLSPNQSKHEFAISLEPITGIPLDVDAKLQINTLIQPISGFGWVEIKCQIFRWLSVSWISFLRIKDCSKTFRELWFQPSGFLKVLISMKLLQKMLRWETSIFFFSSNKTDFQNVFNLYFHSIDCTSGAIYWVLFGVWCVWAWLHHAVGWYYCNTDEIMDNLSKFRRWTIRGWHNQLKRNKLQRN